MADDLEQARTTIAELLREGVRWAGDRLAERVLQPGEPVLSAGARLVMAHVVGEGVSTAQLARKLRVSRQHVHARVKELAAAGLVVVEPAPGSQREKVVRATAAGEDRRGRALAELRRLDDEIADRVGRDDLEHLRSTLRRLLDR
ncbi:MarR family winged helix-turn-helix transcriptional regulator [Saccharothrix coeruleofusca]|uniref:HTH marR-type domain-containing protein n=1 Tax=Saccharothrix coeruleofusca TaxID=33919 RepID=A0A918AVR5_9PSEU|nr:MarR family winged helix-turn-helix transcriptional regulator [Saccharothrix coeruleofusca]MBP2335390.1 DNA-binding MarR family transcriptional regulator [Saccharothrix coeruleofusca]GGP77543.1 hypothetical protein GCM10010185_59070 [Saccharothrix coeruleofusca]